MAKGLAVTTVLASLFLPMPAANAAIVVGQGMDGVKLGQTSKQVRAKLGRPTSSLPGRQSTYPNVTVSFESHNRVLDLTTRSPGQKTSKGIHPSATVDGVVQPGTGSTQAQVVADYPGVACGPAAQPNLINCTLTSHFLGRISKTIFAIFAAPSPTAGQVAFIDVFFPQKTGPSGPTFSLSE